ncbi:MAG: hypothetical protein IK104_04450 [Clostridia bacterium]|nr:hypothetical protein [Clostridia bacterium]
MKKLLAVLLSVTLLLGLCLVPAGAADADETSPFVEGENSLIVFVTGIGQSFTYLFDDEYATPELQEYDTYSRLIADGKYKAKFNLFNSYFDDALNDKDTQKAIARIVLRLLVSAVARRNLVREEDIRTVVESMFGYNILGAKGEVKPNLVTPRYTMPLSEYPTNAAGESEAKNRFYGSIPCREIAREALGENFEDYLYCYNYNAFSYTSENVAGLHAFIETILRENKVGATEVVLVPMSMGASVTSAYLYKYPARADNHVRRVVSVVGCWQGSELIYDLITKRYADNSPDLVYNGIVADMVGEPWGYVVNWALRLFAKPALRDLIDDALGVFVDEIVLAAPSLCALVPTNRYEEVRGYITKDAVREETDAYYEAQKSLQPRFAALEREGITLSFIAGYGLPYGAETSDYKAFGFMYSADKTNSDEIIEISSTAPGTQFVRHGERFADEAGRTLSPDGSIDIANTWYKDSSWYFNGQKHELEYNNVAIDLALALALGRVKTVSDCADPNGSEYFPQFNGSRNIRNLRNDYIPEYDAYVAAGGSVTAEQQRTYDEAAAMMASHVCDRESDDAKIAALRQTLVDLGLEEAPAKEKKINTVINGMFSWGNDVTYKIFGAKGFLDFFV